ncbi:MAG: 4Fe-4S ferredoxin [Bacteroidetes bacterium]|jgi:NAD-dependent dihydropyrimidine dehydrogenase PreA subunit|nr:4Fe-4S ferredoxin [Bacteroidota bacterium]
MVRDILKIDEELCTGCGLCVPNCHEGALQVIDGKVRLVSELMCDGLGACIGYCPEGAITIEKREAEPYDEVRVMEQMVNKGRNTIAAHLKHLKDHGETGYLKEGAEYLRQNRSGLGFDPDSLLAEVHYSGKQSPDADKHHHHSHAHKSGGCPGSKEKVLERPAAAATVTSAENSQSELRHWPVQMHLINPNASYFQGADLLVAADCVAYSTGSFHSRFLKGKSLVIACPKLDRNTEIYVEKLTALIDIARVNTITVMMMEVPCCGGLLQMIKAASSPASRKVPVKQMIVSISGEILKEEWI